MGKRPMQEKRNEGPSLHPRKRMYRARAHSNPLNDNLFDVPITPDLVKWNEHYPSFLPANNEHENPPRVEFADIGCGFGGLLTKLSPLYPNTLMVGMELRDKVAEYVKEMIVSRRRDNPGQYGNISVLRTNAMKYLPNYFAKAQLTKMFFLFPDPHFKVANHRRRIINTSLLTEYAYCLAPGGWLYTITDVQELGEWMKAKLDAHPMFEAISEEDLAADPAAQLLASASDEAQKVARNGGKTYRAVFRRLPAPRLLQPAAGATGGL